MSAPHLRDLAIDALPAAFLEAGVPHASRLAERVARALHGAGALDLADLGLARPNRARLERRFSFGPLLVADGTRRAEDGTLKLLWRLEGGERIETVLLRNLKARTLCLSSQAGCALGCVFCATGRVGLLRNLSAGEITESALRSQASAGERVTDVVFMGQGEPLHNYDAVMTACENLNHRFGQAISRKRITISTAGLVPAMRRFAQERRPWRLHLSLHSAIQETRERLMPVARKHDLGEVIAALREVQERCGLRWVTLQYVAIPDVNMDPAHVEALGRELVGLRYILNVIPYNDAGGGFRPPSWREVKEFTTRLRALSCPVKIRYSGGKREGMGCGQLSAEAVEVAASGGHVLSPPGIFTG